MNSIERYPFGDLLRGFRNRAGMKRPELAKKLDIHLNTLAHWETGNILPKKHRIKELAKALNLSEQEENELLTAGLEQSLPHESGPQFLPSSTHPKSIVQRASIVSDVYTLLTQAGTTAVVLTGLGGVGKSTLAALIYKYAEQQRSAQAGPFTAPALWFTGDLSMTMTDFTRMLLTSLGKAAIEIENLSPRHQAVVLFDAIKSTSHPRLIVIDQFEELLVRKTSDTATDGAGFRDWVKAINSEECASRILLTSRRWPQERHAVCLQEYIVGSLQSAEGIELLQKNGVQESEHELFEAVEHCGGHPLALVLLASLMGRHKLTLQDVWKKAVYTQFWQENIAHNLLNTVYQQQLNDVEQQLLCAFSIYREAVSIDAVLALLAPDQNGKTRIFVALDALLTQHLLQISAGGYYRPHAIVADYALEQLRKQNGQSSVLTFHTAHSRAARYYQQLAPSAQNRKQLRDVHPLIETVWHLCQAEEWQEAYSLMVQEDMHTTLPRLGGTTTLLELYQFMLPLEKLDRDSAASRRIYFYVGEAYQLLGQLEPAKAAYHQFLHSSLQAGDRRGQADAFYYLGVIYDDSGKKEQAVDYGEQALQLYQELGDRNGIGKAFMMLGWAYIGLWNYELAKKYSELALHTFLEIGDRNGQSWTLNKLSALYDNLGYKEQAKEYNEQSVSIMREVGDIQGEAWALAHLGQLYHDLGQSPRAVEALQRALHLFTSTNNYRGEAWVLNSLGKVYNDTGQEEQAHSVLEKSLRIFTQIEDTWGKGAALNKLGRLYHSMGEIQQALAYYEQALDTRAGARDIWGEGQTAENIGILYVEQGQYELALTFLERARTCFERVKSPDLQRVLEEIDMVRQEN